VKRHPLAFLKDPWRLFTALCLVSLVLLTVVSQLWIFRSSLQEKGGSFTLRMSRNGEAAMIEEETLEGFAAREEEPGRFVLSRGGKDAFELDASEPRRLVVTRLAGPMGEPSVDENGLVSLGPGWLSVEQKVFGGLFGAAAPARLSAERLGPGTVALSCAAGAFLNFSDPSVHLSGANYRTFFSTRKYLDAIGNSLVIALASTAIAALFGVSLAYCFARYKVPGTGLVLALVTMASISPPFLGAYAWRMLLGSSGIVNRLLGLHWTIVGMHGVIWVVAWLVFPVVFLLSYDSFTSLDNSFRESSMSLGASKRRTLLKIEIPLAMPGIVNGLYMALMTAFTDFGTPYVISLDLNILPVMIYKEYMSEVGGNLSIASTGSVVMILLSSALLMGQRFYLAKRSYASIKAQQPSAMLPSPGKRAAILAYAALTLAIAFVPHLTVLVTSFFKWEAGILTAVPTLGNYSRLFRLNLGSVWVTLSTGAAATLLTFAVGTGIAYVLVKKRYRFFASALNLVAMVPYIIPGTVLAIGFILVFNQPPLLLTGTWLILVLAYFVRKLPYSVKSAESALYRVHPALEEAAMSLGARPLRSFAQVTFPLILGGVISGATLSFLQIMTEISSTIMLYRPPWKPMTAVIFENTIDAGADFGAASSMTTLLMLMLYVPLYFVTIRVRKPKETRIEEI
jgi:iron(III) transport system permease protein